jgi:hypothetical protein
LSIAPNYNFQQGRKEIVPGAFIASLAKLLHAKNLITSLLQWVLGQVLQQLVQQFLP